MCPLCKAGTESANSPAAAPTQENFWLGTGVLMVVALAFAWLKLLKDFYQYRGLLTALLWSWYSWVFVVFIAALSFVFDYFVWKHWAHNIEFGHIYLVLGHTGASAAFANFVPFLVARMPVLHAKNHDQSVDWHPTEMNVLFAAIRESLDSRTYGKLSNWTTEYSWDEIKYAAHTMRIDQENTRIITRDQSIRLKTEMNGYVSCENPWEDRQTKYELLRRVMTHSSFSDLRLRLKQAKQSNAAGQVNEQG